MTLSELSELVGKCEKAVQWQGIKTAATDLYGPTVTEITVEVEGEYDDEGGTDDYVSEIHAYNEAGEELLYQWSPNRIVQFNDHAYGATTTFEEATEEDKAEWMETYMDDMGRDVWYDLFSGDDEGTWDLTTEPAHPDISKLVWLDHTEDGERHE